MDNQIFTKTSCTISRVSSSSQSKRKASLNTIIWNGLILKGIYGREMYETWYKMQAMVEAGFPLEKIITHRFPVQDYKQGFEAMCSGHSGKVILDWTGLQD